jgi:carboxypeptidase Q
MAATPSFPSIIEIAMFVKARLRACWILYGAVFLSAYAEAGQENVSDTARVAAQLRDSALRDTFAYEFLRELTTRFGARPAGSESANAATAWGADVLRSAGLKKVAIEHFPLKRWSAEHTTVQVVHPQRQSLVATMLGGSFIDEPVEADIAFFPSYKDFLAASPGTVSDKIVVIGEALTRTPGGDAYAARVAERSLGPLEARRRGAKAFVMRSLSTNPGRFASSGATTWSSADTAVPSFSLSPPDALQLERLSRSGPVRLRVASQVSIADATAGNLVAEVIGTRRPDRPVVIAAHLDSWEQGTGAIDDGFGLAVVTAAARLIANLPVPPQRSIRVIWFGAEEVSQPAPVGDFPAARAYARQHRDELGKFLIAGESDWGGGRIESLSLPAGAAWADIAARVGPVLLPLGITLERSVVKTGGPDISILQQAGVPAFRLNQNATSLFDVHHNPDDVFEQVDADALNQNVAAWAALVWMLANGD